jgi:hypothetical protein
MVDGNIFTIGVPEYDHLAYGLIRMSKLLPKSETYEEDIDRRIRDLHARV